MHRILMVGSGVAGSGLARVLRALATQLSATGRYDLHYMPLSSAEAPVDWPGVCHLPTADSHPRRYDDLTRLVGELRPNLVFLLSDPWFLAEYASMPVIADGRVPSVGYCPVDYPLDPSLRLPWLSGFTRLVAFTEAARRELGALLTGTSAADPRFLRVIPHGVDLRAFGPLHPEQPARGRAEARRALYGDDPALQRAFIVLNANRNQPRKRVDLTLEGFARFAQGRSDDVRLHLHMGFEDRGVNVLRIAAELGIRDRILFTQRSKRHPVVSEEQLNLVYNACDVGLNTSSGEGWGLVSFEHGATGAAQVVPDHVANRELWRERGVVLPIEFETGIDRRVRLGLVSPEDVAAALTRLCDDRPYLEERSAAARANAVDPRYRWEAVAGHFDALFQEVLDDQSTLRSAG